MNNLFAISRKSDSFNGYIIWTEDQINYITTEYQKHHSVPTIAKQFGVSAQAIRTVLRKAGVEVLSLQQLKQLEFPRNSNFFETIDTPAKAYWLGFLYADGYISKENTIRINLKKDDEQHLNKFMQAIEYTNGKIKYSTKTVDDKAYYQAYVGIRDSKMKKDLADKGCVNNKSLIITFPYDKMPTSLYSHFIRGYFDGDGCLTWSISGKAKSRNYKINFTGTESMLNSIKEILGKSNLALEYKKNYYVLNINGNKQLKNILAYIYQDATEDIYLTRKKQKYDEFLLQSFGGEPINIGCE